MGGTIAVTLRDQDREHRISSWTNSLPYLIKNNRLIEQDPTHIAEFLGDYHPQNDAHPYLAPFDYGLIVVDGVHNQILDCQNYTDLQGIHSINLFDEYRNIGIEAFIDPELDDTDCALFRALWNKGRITAATNTKTSFPFGYRPATLDRKTSATLMEQLVDQFENHDSNIKFTIDYSPFVVTTYDSYNRESVKAMRQRVVDLGFTLSTKENQLWDQFIKSRRK